MVIWSWSYKSDNLVLSDHTKVIIWFWAFDDHTQDKSDHLVLIIKSNQRTDLDSIARHFLFWLGYLLEEKARSLTLILLTRFRLGLISDGPRTWQQRWGDAWMKLACRRILALMTTIWIAHRGAQYQWQDLLSVAVTSASESSYLA